MTRFGLRSSAVIFAGVAMITSGCATVHPLEAPGGSPNAGAVYVTTQQVTDAVKIAQNLQEVPGPVASELTDYDVIHLDPTGDCSLAENPSEAVRYGDCMYGDPNGKKLMVVYGDSHSDMWAAALSRVAAKAGWRLRVYAKHACPAPELHFRNPDTKVPDEQCDTFHSTAPDAVKALHPKLVIVTSKSEWLLADGSEPTPGQWADGWVTTLTKLAAPNSRLVMLGDIPSWPNNTSRCLAAHMKKVQDCSASATEAAPKGADAERAAADATGTAYIPTAQWICGNRCEPIVADIRVFSDPTHLTDSYVKYLTGAMAEALQPFLT